MLLTSTDTVWFESGLGLTKQLRAAGFEVFKPAAFERGHFDKAVLRKIIKSGIRIIIFMAYSEDTEA